MAEFTVPKCTRCGKTDDIVIVTPLHEPQEGLAWLACHHCHLRIGDYLKAEQAKQWHKEWERIHHPHQDDDDREDRHKKGGHK